MYSARVDQHLIKALAKLRHFFNMSIGSVKNQTTKVTLDDLMNTYNDVLDVLFTVLKVGNNLLEVFEQQAFAG
jgi:hypothetical protein